MKIIAVDDERLAMENMVALIRQIEPGAEVSGFTKPAAVFDYLSQNKADIALLDIEMGEYSGIEIAKTCKNLCPQVNIIFVTGYTQYVLDAFKLHASGYLIKPVRATDLRVEMDNLRHPIPQSAKRVRVQTFGYFEIFVDGQLLKFPRTKCKECLAYLIDRKGARVTYSDLSSVLWEDKPFNRTVQNNTQKIISELMKALREVNVEDIIIKSRLDIAVDTTLMDCDYYEVLSGNITQMNTFTGEYMSNYSWAEFTLGELIRMKK